MTKTEVLMKKYLLSVWMLLACLLGSCAHTKNGKADAAGGTIVPAGVWNDVDGTYINAHGGGVLYYEGKYYWFGEHRPDEGFSTKVGVNCYSSDDLCHWKYEGVALAVSDKSGDDIEVGCIMERPKVIYNARTKKFVMWFHLELKGKGYEAARAALAVSDTPAGPYRYVGSGRVNPGIYPENMTDEERATEWNMDEYKEWWTPRWREAVNKGLFVKRDLAGGQMSRDMTLFVDDDGKAYHIYSSEENLTLQIAELTDDYQGHTGRYIRIFPGGHNEAPAIRMFSATSIWGPWTQHPSPMVGPDAEKTFGGQSTFVLPVGEGQYIFMADVWKPKSLMYSAYIWLPIRFNEAGMPVIEWKDRWNLQF